MTDDPVADAIRMSNFNLEKAPKEHLSKEDIAFTHSKKYLGHHECPKCGHHGPPPPPPPPPAAKIAKIDKPLPKVKGLPPGTRFD